MEETARDEVTRVLAEISEGNEAAADRLMGAA